MKRIVLGVMIILMIGLISGYFWLSRQFEQQLVSYASQVSPHGRLTWDGVAIKPSGQATVRRLRFQPHGSRDQIILDELILDAGGLGALLQVTRQLDNGLLPPRLRISARSLNVPVNRQISDWIGPFNPGLPFASAGCGDFDPFLFYHLGDIGLIGTTLNLLVDYRIVNEGNDLDLRLVISASQLTESNTHLRLGLNDPSRNIREVPSTLGRSHLLTGNFTFTDLGFYDRLMALCAEHTDQPGEEYINHHINAWLQRWAERGLEPGRIPLVAYRHFLLQPGSVTFTAEPDPAPILGAFDRAHFTRLPGEVSMQFAVEDGAPVDLAFSRVDPPPEPLIAPVTEPEPIEEVTPEEDPAIAAGPSPQWELIEANEIGNFIDHRANILTVDGTRFRGRILEVEEDAVYLSIQTRHGLLMRPVSIRSIAEVQVRK